VLPEPGQRFVLSCVPWGAYEQILDALGEHHLRITYDRGALELMSPLPPHEVYKIAFSRLLLALAVELRFNFRDLGSTTFRREDLERGLEPDECFYLGSAARVRDWRRIDLRHDPPPDLAVEIDITRSSLNRMGVYAGLGVPEVWRFDGAALQAYRLTAGAAYEPVAASPALPFLPLAEVPALIEQSISAEDDGELFRSFQTWVRQRVLPLYQSAQPPQPPPDKTE
jgi:Uma2 family endonuclease